MPPRTTNIIYIQPVLNENRLQVENNNGKIKKYVKFFEEKLSQRKSLNK